MVFDINATVVITNSFTIDWNFINNLPANLVTIVSFVNSTGHIRDVDLTGHTLTFFMQT